MELLLSAISAGGLVGAGNQYLCLLIVSGAAKLDLISLSPQMGFMESWWFIGIVAVFWLLTIAPAYASLLAPGVMNAVNTTVNFFSGFAVPVSAALLSLASIGIITEMNPELYDILRTMKLFDPEGGIGTTGFVVAGGSAVAASALTGGKFLAKPAISTATGTAGTVSAPIYETLENLASVVLMALLYVLTRINPWLLVALLALLTLLILGALAYGIYQLWRLGKGIGKVIHLVETRPKAGLSVVAEFLVWGSGWLLWKNWNRGILRMVLWALWLVTIFFIAPAIIAAVSAALMIIPPVAMFSSALGIMAEAAIVVIGLYIGLRSARSLMKTFDEVEPAPAAAPAEAPA
jgi:hypothetical protein